MLECTVILHDRSRIQFSKAHLDGFKGGSTHPCHILLDHHAIKFFEIGDDKNEVCTFTPHRTNIEFDKNSHKLSFTHYGDKDPWIELKGHIGILEKIEKYVSRKTKIGYKGPLCYTPVCKQRDTIFSTGKLDTNLRGFLNLALLALFFAKFRDIIWNFVQYGMNLKSQIELSFTLPEFLAYIISSSTPIFITWFLEKQAFKGTLPHKVVDVLVNANIVGLLIIPIVVCNIFKPYPFPALFYVGIVIGHSLKLVSYASVMNNLRKLTPRIVKLEKENKDIIGEIGEHELSRENLEIILKYKNDFSKLANLKDLLYFLTVPTYCYQLWYPRNPHIRKDFLIKRCVEAFFCWALFAFTVNQYLMPLLDEGVYILEKGSYIEIAERILRLAFPVTVAWILFFFGIFQYIFNIVAEIQRFADRQFYLDWWNCRDLNEYWRTWNLPIHEWFTRHVYFPLLRRGTNKELAKLIVFLISALAHEYWASVPLRVFALWAFIAMLVQMPIMMIEQKLDKILKGSQIGNVHFWISFCFVGQPTALLLYYQIYLDKKAAAEIL